MSGLTIRLEPADRGRHRVVVESGELVHLDTIDVSSDLSRRRFINRLVEKASALEGMREHIDSELIRLAVAPPAASPDAAGPAGEEPWPDPVDGAAVLDELGAFLASYVALPDHAADFLALWLVHTYVPDVSDYTPYVWVSSPVRECGKSTLLELLAHLAYRGQMTGGITAAALYRRIHRSAPTMLLDELDTRLRGDGGELLRGVLNTGFHRSGKFTICVGDDHEDQDFNTFCPKVLAGIGRLWDTVMSRSVPVRLRRASKVELKGLRKVRGDRIAGECRPLRRRLLRLAGDVRDRLAATEAAAPDALGARHCDVWRPLLAIAAVTGGHWPSRAGAAAEAIHGVAGEEGDHGLLLLEDLRDLFDRQKTDALFSETIIQELVKQEGQPWAEYRGDKPLTKGGLASLLRRFEVRPLTVRIGSATAKGYRRSDLAPLFKLYLSPPPATPEQSVTPVTPSGCEWKSAPGPVTNGVHATEGPDAVTGGPAGEIPEETRECDGCDSASGGGPRPSLTGPATGGPDPALPTAWCGTHPNGRPDPGGALPPGRPLPLHATYWKQRGTDWTPVNGAAP